MATRNGNGKYSACVCFSFITSIAMSFKHFICLAVHIKLSIDERTMDGWTDRCMLVQSSYTPHSISRMHAHYCVCVCLCFLLFYGNRKKEMSIQTVMWWLLLLLLHVPPPVGNSRECMCLSRKMNTKLTGEITVYVAFGEWEYMCCAVLCVEHAAHATNTQCHSYTTGRCTLHLWKWMSRAAAASTKQKKNIEETTVMHVHELTPVCVCVCQHLRTRKRKSHRNHRVKLSYMARPPLISFIITFEFTWAIRMCVQQRYFFLRSRQYIYPCKFWTLCVGRVTQFHWEIDISNKLTNPYWHRSETVSKPYFDQFFPLHFINDDFIGFGLFFLFH